RAADDFLVLTEPELGDVVREQLLRSRFAAKVEIEPEEHESWLVVGGGGGLDERAGGGPAGGEAVAGGRIRAPLSRWGYELDESILPAEAGLEETHISFTKGCYPGQEPIARQHYRGKVNRKLRLLEVDAVERGDELVLDGKTVGRITSTANGVALGYVRVEVPDDAVLAAGPRHAKVRAASFEHAPSAPAGLRSIPGARGALKPHQCSA